MRVLVIGQLSLHKGRLEYGNIGNFYIVEPLFRELHRVFFPAEIVTTFQFTNEFCDSENISCLPLDLFYGWNESDLTLANKELYIAEMYYQTGVLTENTPFINEVLKSDIIIDCSGDMWGDNADLAGKDRFIVNLIKDRVAQLLKKPTAMIFGSPGPFTNPQTIDFAKQVYQNFDYVINREPMATKLLKDCGFDLTRTVDSMCPAFLFQAADKRRIREIISNEGLDFVGGKIGFTICGFNFQLGPYQRWPREDREYDVFVEVIEKLIDDLDVDVVLLSHTNGFINTEQYQAIQGRDYPLLSQLRDYIGKRNKIDPKRVHLIETICKPSETKGIIAEFDVFVTGRAHGAIASYSQNTPCVILNYSNGPTAHKLYGFASTADQERYLAESDNAEEIFSKIKECYIQKETITQILQRRNQEIQSNIRSAFDQLKGLVR